MAWHSTAKEVFVFGEDKTQKILQNLGNLGDAIAKLTGELRYPNEMMRQQTEPYNLSSSTIVATPTQPSSREVLATISQPGYERVQIRKDIGRNGRKVYIVNDGPGTLYAIATKESFNWTSEEILIEDGRHIVLYNVYEVRVRSIISGCAYTVTEYDRSNPQDITKAEKIEIVSTDKDTHFTGSIAINTQEKENLTGLATNRYMIRGVNIQSDQLLKYRLVFWGSDTFDSTDLNLDTYIDDVELDMTVSPAFRINNTGQYYLNVGDLQIIYEDYDGTRELHIGLQNESATAKNAGATGEVQLDIKMSPRL